MMVMKKFVAKWGGKLLDRCWQSSPAKGPAIGGNVLKFIVPCGTRRRALGHLLVGRLVSPCVLHRLHLPEA
jgi:hypothetical protein